MQSPTYFIIQDKMLDLFSSVSDPHRIQYGLGATFYKNADPNPRNKIKEDPSPLDCTEILTFKIYFIY